LLDRLRLCLFLVGHVGDIIESCRNQKMSIAMWFKSFVSFANQDMMPSSGERQSARDRVSIAWLRVQNSKATSLSTGKQRAKMARLVMIRVAQKTTRTKAIAKHKPSPHANVNAIITEPYKSNLRHSLIPVGIVKSGIPALSQLSPTCQYIPHTPPVRPFEVQHHRLEP
jgi:hypothetical protein